MGMSDSAIVGLDYARPNASRRQWSKIAIGSMLIPVVAFPSTAWLVDGLSRFMPWPKAQSVGGLCACVVHLAGLAIALAALKQIRMQSARLRGRMLSLIGIALDIVAISIVLFGFYIRSI